MLKIVTIPDPKLREVSTPVETIDKKIFDFAKDLADTLRHASDPPGVGLSAVQIGKTKRMFVTLMPQDQTVPMSRWYKNNTRIEYFINPIINAHSQKLTLGGTKDKPFLEGCLSMPKLYGPVWRYEWVEVDYISFDERKQPIAVTKRFEDVQARVIQHEQDHLDGILFTDHSLQDSLPVYEEQNGDLVEISIA